MFKPKKISPEQAAGMRWHFSVVYGPGWETEVRLAWKEQSWIKKLYFFCTGETAPNFFKEYNRAIAEFDALNPDDEDGYCGDGCLCFTEDGEPAAASSPIQVLPSTVDELRKGEVL